MGLGLGFLGCGLRVQGHIVGLVHLLHTRPMSIQIHRSVAQQRHSLGLPLLHIVQLLCHRTAITSCLRIAPCNNRPIAAESSKGTEIRGLEFLHVLQLSMEISSDY